MHTYKSSEDLHTFRSSWDLNHLRSSGDLNTFRREEDRCFLWLFVHSCWQHCVPFFSLSVEYSITILIIIIKNLDHKKADITFCVRRETFEAIRYMVYNTSKSRFASIKTCLTRTCFFHIQIAYTQMQTKMYFHQKLSNRFSHFYQILLYFGTIIEMSSEDICFLDKVYLRVLESNTFKPRALKMTGKTNWFLVKLFWNTVDSLILQTFTIIAF